MDKRTGGIVATVGTALTCGCCGLFMCIFGAVTATGNMPYNTDVNGVQTSGMLPSGVGFALLCLSVIFVAIPVVVGILTLRKKPEAAVVSNDPLPPAA